MNDKIKAYIRLMYSKDSELNAISLLEERKKKACEKSGLEYDKSQHIIHLQDEPTNKAIFEFLNSENPNEFIKLMADQQLFWEMQQIQMEPLDRGTGKTKIDDETALKNMNLKTTISAKSEELLQRIKKMYDHIYKGDAEKDMAAEVIRMKRPEERIKKKPANVSADKEPVYI